MGVDPIIARSNYVVAFVSDHHSTSHVENDDARMISFDGPRSKPFIGERDLLRDVSGFFRLET